MLHQELSPEERLRLERLTPRETEAALLVARGLLVREAADEMQAAPGTVQTLLKRGREKLGCRNARELTSALLRSGIVTPQDLIPASDQPSTEHH